MEFCWLQSAQYFFFTQKKILHISRVESWEIELENMKNWLISPINDNFINLTIIIIILWAILTEMESRRFFIEGYVSCTTNNKCKNAHKDEEESKRVRKFTHLWSTTRQAACCNSCQTLTFVSRSLPHLFVPFYRKQACFSPR